MKTMVALCIVLAATAGCAADSGRIVTVTGGQIRGATLDKGGAVFKGIPFAQPPRGRASLARADAGEIVDRCA